MERLDKRAPFTATGGIIPPEFQNIKTPCYILDEKALIENAKLLGGVAERTGCKMLLAQKAFSNYDCYPFFEPYLAGTEASGLYEARLGAEEMAGKEVHVFCAGYRADEFEELLQYADHIVFNSTSQLLRFGRMAKEAGKSVGLRINPECSTQEGHEIYDPCAPGSRMGTTRVQWDEAIVKNPELMELLDGVHFHTLCEQDSDDLETTLASVKKQFGDLIAKVKWINFGGGHHITRPGYDIERLEQCIRMAQEEWKVEVYLEPGEAWALNAGFLLTSVLDVLKNGDTQIAIVDASAACHMPDVLEMPIAHRFLAHRMRQQKTRLQSDLAVQPACLGISLETINSANYRNTEISFCLEIWRFIRLAKIIHLTGCHCRISGSDMLTEPCSS